MLASFLFSTHVPTGSMVKKTNCTVVCGMVLMQMSRTFFYPPLISGDVFCVDSVGFDFIDCKNKVGIV